MFSCFKVIMTAIHVPLQRDIKGQDGEEKDDEIHALQVNIKCSTRRV